MGIDNACHGLFLWAVLGHLQQHNRKPIWVSLKIKKKKTAVGSNNSKIGLSSGIAGSWCLSSDEMVKMGTTSYRLKFYLPKERASFPMVSVQMLGVMFIGLIRVSYGKQYSACLSAFIHIQKSVGPQLNKLNGVQ